MIDWQPVGTAPKDGSWFMTWSPESHSSSRIDFAQWEDDYGWWCKVCCGWEGVTHWAPIPDGPTEPK